MFFSKRSFWAVICLAPYSFVMGADSGSTSISLDSALQSVNAGPDFTLNVTEKVDLSEQVRAVNVDESFSYQDNPVVVNGNNMIVSGSTMTRVFAVTGDNTEAASVPVTFQNITIQDGSAVGGAGGAGGLGAGGGLYVGPGAIVVLDNCSIINCKAQAGAALPGTVKGGGGLKGNALGLGGGGFGGSGSLGGGGASGFPDGNADGTSPGSDFDGGTGDENPGVGGTGNDPAFENGGFGAGAGGTEIDSADGGQGGVYGGGGASTTASGGDGRFGGGGGAGAVAGGAGGFGAGGAIGATPGDGGFGGGNATMTLGGVGAAFGGGIFLETGADLTIQGTFTISGNDVLPAPSGVPNADENAGMGTLGDDIFMMSESVIRFDSDSDITIPSAIKGNQGNAFPGASTDTTVGGIVKTGSGKLVLVGENTFTGTTTATGGTIEIQGSVVSDVAVDPAGSVQGTFSVLTDAASTGGNLTNGGKVTAGLTGKGRVKVDRVYTQSASGTLVVDVTPTGNTATDAAQPFLEAETAMLDGTLEVVFDPGNYIAGMTYTIVSGDTGNTVFSAISQVGALAGQIPFEITYGSAILTILGNRLFEDQIIDSGVPTQVANCFQQATISPTSDFALVAQLLGMLSNPAVNSALFSLAPVKFGALEWINERNNSYVADLLSHHLFELCCSPRDCCSCDCDSSAWVTVFGNIMDNTKRIDNLERFDANAVGVLAGLDFCCGPNFYYGASFGYTHTHLIWRNNGGKGNLNSYYGALYGSWNCDCYTVDASVLGGGTDNDLKRKIVFPGVDRVAKSDLWSYFFTAHLGMRGCWNWCCTNFEPFALADYHYFNREGFREKGADSLNLKVQSKDQNMIRAEAGLKAYWELMAQCYCVAPYLGLSWVGEFPLHASKQKAFFINQDCLMNTKSYDSSVQLASPQGGLKWTCCDGASLTLGYKGLFNNKTRINQVEGRFEWIF